MKNEQPIERLAYTRTEVAQMLGFKNAITVDRLAARGLLRPNRTTRRPLYSKEEIQRFLREGMAD